VSHCNCTQPARSLSGSRASFHRDPSADDGWRTGRRSRTFVAEVRARPPKEPARPSKNDRGPCARFETAERGEGGAGPCLRAPGQALKNCKNRTDDETVTPPRMGPCADRRVGGSVADQSGNFTGTFWLFPHYSSYTGFDCVFRVSTTSVLLSRPTVCSDSAVH
jgi:hypothetical protein